MYRTHSYVVIVLLLPLVIPNNKYIIKRLLQNKQPTTLAGSEAATSLLSTLTRIRGPTRVPVPEVAILSACPVVSSGSVTS